MVRTQVEVSENTIEQSWVYGRHHVHREQFFYLDDDGEVKMDVTVTIDHWEKFVFHHSTSGPHQMLKDEQEEILKLLPYLDSWDKAHP